MPEIATETTPSAELTSQITSITHTKTDDITQQAAQLNLDAKDTSLSYDAAPFIPRSVITENKLLAAFKNPVLSSSDFDSGESAGEFLFAFFLSFCPCCNQPHVP